MLKLNTNGWVFGCRSMPYGFSFSYLPNCDNGNLLIDQNYKPVRF